MASCNRLKKTKQEQQKPRKNKNIIKDTNHWFCHEFKFVFCVSKDVKASFLVRKPKSIIAFVIEDPPSALYIFNEFGIMDLSKQKQNIKQ